jgi:DNA-directed RNA polymerase subunit beta'
VTANYPLTGPEAIEHALSRIDLDELEAEQRQVITSKKKTARPRAVRLLGIIAGLRKNQVGAGELMLKSVPVIPPKFRPFSVTGDTFLPGDANEMYRDLLEYRRLYQKTEESLGREGSGEVYGDLVKAVRATYGFGDSPNPKTHARGVKGFFQAVTGTSPKTGFFQSKMLSKPVDTVARGVIIPDADYDMNEVGLPAEHAWKLYGSYIQRRLVRSGLAPAAALRHVKDRTPQALKALESEMLVRPVVATRSPAWHKFNVVGANPKIVEGDAIRINTWITDGLTADFDGDTMSIHLPSTDAAIKDVRERMMPDKMLWSVKDRDKVVPTLKHEQQIGINLGGTQPLKNKHTFVNETDAMRAIESGQVDLNDDIDINPSFVPAAPVDTPSTIDR